MEVLFEAKKNIACRNRLVRAYFSDVLSLLFTVFMIIFLRVVDPPSDFSLLFGVLFAMSLSQLYRGHNKARVYITKVVYNNGKIEVTYLFIDTIKEYTFSIENIPYYEKNIGTGKDIFFFNLPNNERLLQYFIGEWNEGVALGIIAKLDRFRYSVNSQ
jgi:hypothetical protein